METKHFSVPVVTDPKLMQTPNWRKSKLPERKKLTGHFIHLEPLNAKKHGNDLHEFSSGPGAEEHMKFLIEKPETRKDFQKWLENLQNTDDPILFVMVDKTSGKAVGQMSFKCIDSANGVIELGHNLHGPLITRKPGGTESFYLACSYLFEELGYRRIVARASVDNVRSIKTLTRLGMMPEGVFRQFVISKGRSHDMVWFSIIDKEWPSRKNALVSWLSPGNFDENGRQKKRIEELRNFQLCKI